MYKSPIKKLKAIKSIVNIWRSGYYTPEMAMSKLLEVLY